MRLSAVLAVRDEERMLEGALASLAFCDEIVVVVDDRTTDRTEEIARRQPRLAVGADRGPGRTTWGRLVNPAWPASHPTTADSSDKSLPDPTRP